MLRCNQQAAELGGTLHVFRGRRGPVEPVGRVGRDADPGARRGAGGGGARSAAGKVASADGGLGGYDVTLYRTRGRQGSVPLGRDVTEVSGRFAIRYETAGDADGVLYLVARRGRVALATVLTGSPSPLALVAPVRPTEVVINERSTVAVGFALAQFLAAATPRATGSACATPAPWSATWSTSRAAKSPRCWAWHRTARGPRRSPPSTRWPTSCRPASPRARPAPPCSGSTRQQGRGGTDTLQAIVNIARNPWRNVDRLYRLSTKGPQDYRPALARRRTPGPSH